MSEELNRSKEVEILLVEDSETDRMLAVEALRQSRIGNNVHCVEDGEKAMLYLRQQSPYENVPTPDLILLDLNLPRKDGREVLSEIKSDEYLKFIPVIVLTTSKAREDIAGAYEEHANCYITKPLDFDQFGRVLRELESFWFKVVTLPAQSPTMRPHMGSRAGVNEKIVKSAQGKIREYRALILEDSPTDALLIKAALAESSQVKFTTREAIRTGMAETMLGEEDFDVVIADLGLPDSQGLDTVTRLHKVAGGVPIVVLTMLDDEKMGLDALREGATDYVVKGEINGRLLARTIHYAIDRRKIEDQLRHAQRMESIGVLAGGIAHDFNNLMMIVRGNAEVQQRLGDGSAILKKTSKQILDAADRATVLTRQLLAFSRRERVHLIQVDFNEVLKEFAKMVGRLLGPTIDLGIELTSDSLPVLMDPGLMEQVIMNFAVNGRDAMDGRGVLKIRTQRIQIDATSRYGVPPDGVGEYMCMTVEDEGKGISAENLPHIFEPFYTTKEVGKGTGLGLSTAFGIVQQHRGVLDVQSEEGKGTVFSVVLPLRAEVDQDEATSAAETPQAKGETILVVDDEKMVRELTVMFLEMNGFKVIEANTGADVQNRWDELQDEVDLVLTDVIMPEGVSGHELGQWIHQRKPEMKIIYCSGFSRNHINRDYKLKEGDNFLTKPFSLDSLINIVHRNLSGEP